MAALVVYCLKDVDLTAHPFSLAEIIAVAVTALAHIWKRNTLLASPWHRLLHDPHPHGLSRALT